MKRGRYKYMEGRMATGFVSEQIGDGALEKVKYILRGKEAIRIF
jgi:hypothetical protein